MAKSIREMTREECIEFFGRWILDRAPADLAAEARQGGCLSGVYTGKSTRISRVAYLAYLRGVVQGINSVWEAHRPITLREARPTVFVEASGLSMLLGIVSDKLTPDQRKLVLEQMRTRASSTVEVDLGIVRAMLDWIKDEQGMSSEIRLLIDRVRLAVQAAAPA